MSMVRSFRKKLNSFKKSKISGSGIWKIEIRRFFPFLFRNGAAIQLTNGLNVFLSHDPVEEKILLDLLFKKKDLYFPPTLKLSKPDPLILDLGAHHGYFTLFALHYYPEGKVIAVEPSSEGVRLIKHNILINKMSDRVTVVCGALAEKEAKGTLKICKRGSWGNSIFDEETDVSGTEEIDLFTLPSILKDERPDIIKCNAEGAEFFLAEQLRLTQLRPEFMIVMIHKEFGSVENLIKEFEHLGYACQLTGTEKRPALHLFYNRESR